MSDVVTAGWAHDRFCHEGFFFDDDAELRDRCGSFAVEAAETAQPLLVVASESTLRLLRTLLGARRVRDCVVFVESDQWWRGSAFATLLAYQRAMADLVDGGSPWRLIGEPTWIDDAGGAMWHRLEAACNESFADLPYYSLCLHDERRLSPSSTATARSTHPLRIRDGGTYTADEYLDPVRFLRASEPEWSDAPSVASVASIESPAHARNFVAQCASDVVDDARTESLMLSASELATNALRAGGEVTMRAWTANGHFVGEVADTGPGFDAELAGYVPPPADSLGGRGLWLTRSVLDDVAIRSTTDGTTVRMYACHN